jgi:hypothetical protein
VHWLQTAWPLLRDIVLTGLGVWIIFTQVEAASPDAALLVVALGCIAPAARSAVATILSAPGSSLESPHPQEEQPSEHSPSSDGGTVEQREG